MESETLLPALPIPELDEACSGLLDLARPLLTDAEYAETEQAVADFRAGPGQALHSALLGWKNSLGGNRSWLRPFWDDMYLEYRDPLPVNMNYTFCMDSAVWGAVQGAENAPVVFISALTRTLLALWRNALPPEPGKIPLDMEQARFVLATRIPAPGKDVLALCLPVPDPCALVLCRGHSFLLRLSDAAGRVATPAAIAQGLNAVRRAAAELGNSGLNPFIYSAMPREEAAALRAELLPDLKNRAHLALAEQALFTICLDEESTDPALHSFEHDLLTGPPENRFFDKSLQIIARPDGTCGVNIEHAGCDASIWLYLFSQAAELLENSEFAARSAVSELPLPSLLDWNISDGTARKLTAAREDFLARKGRVDMARLIMPEYSRARVKAFQCSPDAFLQMGFQAAQYQHLPRFSSSYEAVAVRGFAEGRTECARASSAEAKALAQALVGNESGQRSAEEIRELFRAAEARHAARLDQCQRGHGVERYMLGLECMFQLHGAALGINAAPALFSNPGWRFARRNVLSTSGSGSSVCSAFGFGAVDPEGFGLGYNYGAALSVTVTAFPQSPCTAAEFAASIKHHLDALAKALA